MNDLKVSVIGTGHLGTIHAKLWKENLNAKLAGVYDLDTNRAKEIAGKFDCRCFESIDEAINKSDIVTIAVPTNRHFDVAKIFVEAGKHCLIEKPITSTYEEALKLIELAKIHNVAIQVGHVERFNPAIASLSGYDLNPLFIEAHRLSQFTPRATDVSVIHDLMIHDIDIMLWTIKSKVSRIDANGVSIITETPDIANARITFENGAVANLTASRISANPMRKMRMFQQGAYISIDFGRQDVEVFRIIDEVSDKPDMLPATMLGTIEAGLKDKKIVYEKPVVPQLNAIAEEQKAFVKSIMDNQPVLVGAEEASEALRIAEVISSQIVG